MNDINFILSEFGITDLIKYTKIESGHINDTYKIYSSDSTFILQKVNTEVFKEPEKIMHNIDITLSCIKREMRLKGENPDGKFPDYIMHGKNSYLNHNGFWRIYKFLDNTITMDKFDNINIINGFGKLLGSFHKYTENIDINNLYITIPDFHNINKNISKLFNFDKNAYNYKLFMKIYDYTQKNYHVLKSQQLVHNDVKCSNILINTDSNEPCAIIDLDTIMPGFAAFDFGDAVRSACTDNDKLNIYKLKAFSSGYFSAGSSNLSAKACTLGILSITAELASRYTYDYITCGNYFKNMSSSEKLNKSNKLSALSENIYSNINEIVNVIENSMRNNKYY